MTDAIKLEYAGDSEDKSRKNKSDPTILKNR
jgi:hypothetical protein